MDLLGFTPIWCGDCSRAWRADQLVRLHHRLILVAMLKYHASACDELTPADLRVLAALFDKVARRLE